MSVSVNVVFIDSLGQHSEMHDLYPSMRVILNVQGQM